MAYNGSLPQVVNAGGTGISTTTSYGVVCGGTSATGAFQNAGAGSSGQVLTSTGSSSLPSFQAVSAPSFCIQQKRSLLSGTVNCTANFGALSTTPTASIGTSIISVTITPTNASSILVLEANSVGGINNQSEVLFICQNGVTNALFAVVSQTGNGSLTPSTMSIKGFITAGTTSAITFTLYGATTNGPSAPFYVNQYSGPTTLFGGGTIPNTSLFVTEYSS